MRQLLTLLVMLSHAIICSASTDGELDSLADRLEDRWRLQGDGIRWPVGDAHSDHLEFSGE